MNAAYVMVILTLLADGQLSAAFVNTESQARCETRATAVEAILKKGGADVQQIRCVPSALQFTRFSHDNAGTAPRHAYLLSLGEASLALAPVKNAKACRRQRERSAPASGVERHCVTSTQSLADPSVP